MPRSYLSQTMPDKSSLSVEEPTTPTDSPKTAKQKKVGMRRSTSLRKSTELEESSSGEEGDKDSGKEVCHSHSTVICSTKWLCKIIYSVEILRHSESMHCGLWW